MSAARRLHVVQEIAQAMSTSLNLDETLQTIIAETRRLVPFNRAAVMLHDGDVLRVVAVSEDFSRPAELIGQVFALQESAAGWVVKQRRIWTGASSDINKYPDTRLLCPPDGECQIVPLQLQRRVIGVFVLGGQNPAMLFRADQDNLTRIAGQVVIAIERVF